MAQNSKQNAEEIAVMRKVVLLIVASALIALPTYNVVLAACSDGTCSAVNGHCENAGAACDGGNCVCRNSVSYSGCTCDTPGV